MQVGAVSDGGKGKKGKSKSTGDKGKGKGKGKDKKSTRAMTETKPWDGTTGTVLLFTLLRPQTRRLPDSISRQKKWCSGWRSRT